MDRPARRHLYALGAALGAVALLTAVVVANGYRDLGSPFWALNALSVGAVVYALVVLARRAAALRDGVQQRVAVLGALAGGVLVPLAFVRPSALSALGVAMAVVLTAALGVTLGLAAAEGLRRVGEGADPRRAA